VNTAGDRQAAVAPSRQAQRQYWSLWGLSGLAAVALLGKIVIDISVGRLEGELLQKQQFVNQTMVVSRLNVQLIQGMANTAARNGDTEIAQLLNEQGIRFEVPQNR